MSGSLHAAGWNLTFEPSDLLRWTLFLRVNVLVKVHHFKTGRIHDVTTTSKAPSHEMKMNNEKWNEMINDTIPERAEPLTDSHKQS